MNEQILEKLENLSISMGHLTGQVTLAEQMIEEYCCGNITDNEEMARERINATWSFLVGLVEYAKAREHEVDVVFGMVQGYQDAKAVTCNE